MAAIRNLSYLSMLVSSLFLLGCSSSNDSNSQSPVHSSHFSERNIHELEEAISFLDTLVLRLESGSRLSREDETNSRHAGDIGGHGIDTFHFEISKEAEYSFQIEEADLAEFQVSVEDQNGVAILDLNTSQPSATHSLMQGTYTVHVQRTSSGDRPIPVFFHEGSFSRSCEGCDLYRVDLLGMDLSGLNFQRADLREANLAEVDCTGSHFDDARLDGAMLSGATCEGASFAGASLVSVGSLGADFSNVSFSEEQVAEMESVEATQLGSQVGVESSGNNDSVLRNSEGTSQVITPGTFSQPQPVEVVQAAQDRTVTRSNPLIVKNGSGAPIKLDFETLTLKDGGFIEVHSPVNMTVNSMNVEGSGSYILFIGRDGFTGADGRRGRDGYSGSPYGSQGGGGGAGLDGLNSPTAYIHVQNQSGTLQFHVAPGRGGNGGNGGQGGRGANATSATANHPGTPVGAGGSGGDGGSGGNGGDGGSVSFVYSQSIGQILVNHRNSYGGVGGQGGPGGPGGQGGPSGPNGSNGNPGRRGAPARVVLYQGY